MAGGKGEAQASRRPTLLGLSPCRACTAAAGSEEAESTDGLLPGSSTKGGVSGELSRGGLLHWLGCGRLGDAGCGGTGDPDRQLSGCTSCTHDGRARERARREQVGVVVGWRMAWAGSGASRGCEASWLCWAWRCRIGVSGGELGPASGTRGCEEKLSERWCCSAVPPGEASYRRPAEQHRCESAAGKLGEVCMQCTVAKYSHA